MGNTAGNIPSENNLNPRENRGERAKKPATESTRVQGMLEYQTLLFSD